MPPELCSGQSCEYIVFLSFFFFFKMRRIFIPLRLLLNIKQVVSSRLIMFHYVLKMDMGMDHQRFARSESGSNSGSSSDEVRTFSFLSNISDFQISLLELWKPPYPFFSSRPPLQPRPPLLPLPALQDSPNSSKVNLSSCFLIYLRKLQQLLLPPPLQPQPPLLLRSPPPLLQPPLLDWIRWLACSL